MPFDFIRSVLDLVAPRPVQGKKSMKELMAVGSVIEAYNECFEKVYIQLERNIQMERRMDLEVLITKCKRLLSFVETRGELQNFDHLPKTCTFFSFHLLKSNLKSSKLEC